MQVVDFCNGDHGHLTQVGVHHDGLRVCVGDDTDAAVTLEAREFLLKTRTEIVALEIVNTAEEAFLLRVRGETAALRAEVAVVVRAIEEVCDDRTRSYCSEKTAHGES